MDMVLYSLIKKEIGNAPLSKVESVDGNKIEGSFRAHQVPIAISPEQPENLPLLEKWLKSYNVDKLFDSNGRLIKELRDLAPSPAKCMGASAYANGGLYFRY